MATTRLIWKLRKFAKRWSLQTKYVGGGVGWGGVGGGGGGGGWGGGGGGGGGGGELNSLNKASNHPGSGMVTICRAKHAKAYEFHPNSYCAHTMYIKHSYLQQLIFV